MSTRIQTIPAPHLSADEARAVAKRLTPAQRKAMAAGRVFHMATRNALRSRGLAYPTGRWNLGGEGTGWTLMFTADGGAVRRALARM